MDITPEEAIEVNKKFGGHLRSDSSIRFAASHATYTKSNYRKAAIWIRAIAVDHPFSDANKRTALYAIGRHICIQDEIKMGDAIIAIARQNIASIDKIIEILKNSNRRNHNRPKAV